MYHTILYVSIATRAKEKAVVSFNYEKITVLILISFHSHLDFRLENAESKEKEGSNF